MPEAPLGLPLLQLQHGAPRGAGSEQRDCSWGRDVPAARCSEGGARDHAARVKPCMRLSVPLPGRGHLYGEENKYELSLPPPALRRPRGIHAPRPPSRWRCLSLTARSLAFISARTDLFIQRRFAWSFSIVNLQPCERQRPRWSPSSRAVLFSLVAQDPCSRRRGRPLLARLFAKDPSRVRDIAGFPRRLPPSVLGLPTSSPSSVFL